MADQNAVKKKKSLKNIFVPYRKKSNKSLQFLPLLADEPALTASVKDNPLPAGAAAVASPPPTTFGEILREAPPGRALDHDILHATDALWGNKSRADVSQSPPSTSSTLQSPQTARHVTSRPSFSTRVGQSHANDSKPKLYVSTPATTDWVPSSPPNVRSFSSSSSPETTATPLSLVNTAKPQEKARLQRKDATLPGQCQRVPWDPTQGYKDRGVSGRSHSSGTVNSPSTMRSSVFTKASAITDATVDMECPADRVKSMTEEDAIDLYLGGFQDDNDPHDIDQGDVEQAKVGQDMSSTRPGIMSQDAADLVESEDDEEILNRHSEHLPSVQGPSEDAAPLKTSDCIVGTVENQKTNKETPRSTQHVVETRPSSPPAVSPTSLLSAEVLGSWFWHPPVLSSPTLTHDKYGFKKATRDISLEEYDVWYSGYMPYQERRAAKWVKLLEHHKIEAKNPRQFPKPSHTVERFIRKGIPSGWRGEMWFFYSGGKAAFEKNPSHYSSLVLKCQTSALLAKDKEAIERDLHRTFPENLYFKPIRPNSSPGNPDASPLEMPILTALRRVLRALAVEHPEIGYCQSLNFLTGMLLLFLSEEQAFWMLHIITTKILPGSHEESLEGTDIDTWVLMQALHRYNHAVWAKVGEDKKRDTRRLPEVSMCTTSWFMSAFIGNLPVEAVLRIWDMMFYEGSVVLFRVALAIFKYGEVEIANINDPMETLQVIQNIPRKMLDVAGLFDIAHRKPVDAKFVEKKRSERKEYLRKA